MILIIFIRWIIKKNNVEVIVQEGNTELVDGSLVVSGYDVSGRVTSENEPVTGVSFILFGVRFIVLYLLLYLYYACCAYSMLNN